MLNEVHRIVNPRINHPGGLSISGFLRGAYSRGEGRILGGLNIFLVVGHMSVEICLLVSYFFDSTHTSSTIFFKVQTNFHEVMAAFSFLALQSTNRVLNRYSQVLLWGLIGGRGFIRGGLIRGFTVQLYATTNALTKLNSY